MHHWLHLRDRPWHCSASLQMGQDSGIPQNLHGWRFWGNIGFEFDHPNVGFEMVLGKHRHWIASWVIHLKRRCTWKMPKKPSNDVFVQTCLGKTKPHSCLGFRETTNAQWLTSVNLTSQRLKSCFHMPRDRSVRSHLDGWHQGHRSQSGPVQVKSRRIQSTRTGTPMCCNASTCLQHATGPRVRNPPAVYVILNHFPQENWDSHLGFLDISALGSHKQIGLMFYQFAARVCSQFIHGEVHGLTWQAGKTHARTGRPWNFVYHLKCIRRP